MFGHRRLLLISTIAALAIGSGVYAQWQRESRPRGPDREFQRGRGDRYGRGFRGGGRRYRNAPDRSEYPAWTNPDGFEDDVFTFVRIRYSSRITVVDGRWDNDYPDSDWNFSYRLQQLTSLKVDPHGRVLRLSDPDLFNYPFIYMLGVRDLWFSDDEVIALRRYLLNGGFLMVDDFWSPQEWWNLYDQIKRVFPDREPRELDLSHPIFHMVFDLDRKPQVPSIQAFRDGYEFEYWHGPTYGDEEPHFWALFDDHGRMMALMCHNNDIGDGWEREGEDRAYFERYSEKLSYPMGVNIIVYVMTH